MIELFLFLLIVTLSTIDIPNSVVGPSIAGIIGIVVSAMGVFVWRADRRSRSNKESIKRHGRTIYGDADDDRQRGLTTNISNIQEELEDLSETIDQMDQKVDSICNRIDD